MSKHISVDRLSTAAGASGTPAPTLLDLARQTQAMRANTASLFPREVFRDSAWDMMLELFVAGQEGRPLYVKELVLVSGETSTSALRRIDRLEDAGLIKRQHDPTDHRRLFVRLTLQGSNAMTAMLRNLFLTNGDTPTSAANPSPRSFKPSAIPGMRD